MKTQITILAFILALDASAQETPIVTTPPPVETSNAEGQFENTIIEFPDVEAQFPGGIVAMKKYVVENLVFPILEPIEAVEGRVYAKFVVSEEGEIQSITIERRVHPALDQAVYDLIANMPKWIPAEMNGKKVASLYHLPINFTPN